MKTLEIPVKFQNGDIIYTTKQTKQENTCDICEGTGKIRYNEKDMKCPECMGIGKFVSNKNTNVVCEEPFNISSIKININRNKEIAIKYKGYCGNNSYNRSEDNLFSTIEEAQARCDDLNKDKVFIKVDDIVIQDSFKETPPSIDKIQDKLDYYKSNGKLDKNIIINNSTILQDGYINYLICKLLNIEYTKVVVES